MVTIDTIRNEILDFTIENNVIEVEFDDYILEVDLKYLQGQEINKDNLAKVIYNNYR
ncbi:hypothetical protein AB2063_001110 [Clostridium botulinum]